MSHSVDWYQRCVTFQKRGSLIYTAAEACNPAVSEIWTWWQNEKFCTFLESDLCHPARSQWSLLFCIVAKLLLLLLLLLLLCSVGGKLHKTFIVLSTVSPQLIQRIPFLRKSSCGFMYILRFFVSFMLSFERDAVPVSISRSGSVAARRSFLIKGYFAFSWAV